MICVDISNVWGQLSLPDLLALEQEVAAAHEAVAETEKDLPEADYFPFSGVEVSYMKFVCLLTNLFSMCCVASVVSNSFHSLPGSSVRGILQARILE